MLGLAFGLGQGCVLHYITLELFRVAYKTAEPLLYTVYTTELKTENS